MKKVHLFPVPFLLYFFINLFISPPQLSATAEGKGQRPNVLLITIDTLRVDRLSCYGSEHLQTPNIDTFAERGVLFSKAFAHTTTTLPSHTNIICGTIPLYHGVHDNYGFTLGEKFLTLAEHLKTYGYSTGAIIGGFPLDSRFGLSQGFDVYDDDFGKKYENEIPAELVIEKALSWLKQQKSQWFLWIHCYDAHDPYSPPEPFKKQFESDLYNGEVAYVDHSLNAVLDFLRKNDLFDDTLIVFTGDHGEALGQHGELTHGFLAYNEVLRIPLIICSPGIPAGRSDQYVCHADIFPTICDLLDVKKPDFLQGISLLPVLEGKKLPPRIFYFESLQPYYSRGWAPLRGIIQNNEKYIDSPIPELYNLEEDFAESNNLAKETKLDAYKMQLDQIIKSQSNPEKTGRQKTVDQEALKKLASLGYIANPNPPQKSGFGPEDDIKTLLPNYYKAYWTKFHYEKGEASLRDAMESFKEVLTDTAKVDVAYEGLALVYKEMGRLDDAIEVLKTGIENHPSCYGILWDLIQYLSEAGKYQDVISLCNNIHVVQMDFEPLIYIALGYAYWKTGDLENAEKTYEKAFLIDDENPALLSNFGNLYLSLFQKTKKPDDQKKAVEFFKKAVELDPNHSQAYDGLGLAYLVTGDLDNAILNWEKALNISPSHAMVTYNLARAYFTKGNNIKALDLLQNYLKNYSRLLSPTTRKYFDELIQKCSK
jgi:arylsulfatase A-like enzyme/Flp pilus assembly protein TadD